MRIGSGSRNLIGFVAIAVVAFGVTLYLVPAAPSSEAPSSMSDSPDALPADEAVPLPEASVTRAPMEGDPAELPGMRGYVLPLAELRGVSVGTPPGSRLEIWVTWRRDVASGSQVQRVVPGAVLGGVHEPTVPEGPQTVEIFIPVQDFPDFLAAHEFGSLNAAVVP